MIQEEGEQIAVTVHRREFQIIQDELHAFLRGRGSGSR